MKTWTPFVVTVALALLMIALPIVVSLFDAEFAQAGWALYFFIVPAAIILLLLGFVISLTVFFVRKRN